MSRILLPGSFLYSCGPKTAALEKKRRIYINPKQNNHMWLFMNVKQSHSNHFDAYAYDRGACNNEFFRRFLA